MNAILSFLLFHMEAQLVLILNVWLWGLWTEKTHYIRQVLISVRLYGAKLSGEQTASNILLQLRRFNLEPNYWRGSMMDRASTNIKAIKMVKEVTQYSPTLVPYLSHTTSLPGKDINKKCKLMHKLRKAFNASITSQDKMSSLFKEHFGFSPKVAGGWGLRWGGT